MDLPSREALGAIVDGLRGALFPMRLGPPELRQEAEDYYVGHTLDAVLNALLQQVQLELRHGARQNGGLGGTRITEIEAEALVIVRDFAATLAQTRALLDSDVIAAYRGDPAARSVDEILLCYPGIGAIIHHRIAHRLYTLGVPLLARIVAELAHGQTGIDIHPGAQVGAGFFIDHGTGVVIGETAVIGERVRLYQAVTLGAKRFEAEANGDLKKGSPPPPHRRGRRGHLRRRHHSWPRHHRPGIHHRRQRLAHAQCGARQPHHAGEYARRHCRRRRRHLMTRGVDLSERFGGAVRRLREQHGWSQEQLAARADLNRSNLGEVERAAVMPSLAVAAKLARALEVSLSRLIADCEAADGSDGPDGPRDPAGFRGRAVLAAQRLVSHP